MVYQSLYSRINEYGFIETPAVKVVNKLAPKADKLVHRIADEDILDGKKVIVKDGDMIDEKTAKAIEKVHGK